MLTEFDARAVERFLSGYARAHAAGAFGAPTRTEVEAAHRAGRLSQWHDAAGALICVAIHRTLDRHVKRTDWLGRRFTLPAGASVVDTVAHSPGFVPPELVEFGEYVIAYADDREVGDFLAANGYEPAAHQISASSEIKVVWGPPVQAVAYPAGDLVTVASWPIDFDEAAVVGELDGLGGWYDDYPFYSDGSWGALSLRGYWPDDPTLGVKPSEMAQTWKDAHPDDLARACDWTGLAEQCPAITRLARAVARDAGGLELQRVRLLRMGGTTDKPHRLGRHTDITDREAGTLPGQVIRFHVPLWTHPWVTMQCWGLDGIDVRHHCDVGRVWYLDARKPHAVDNPSPVDRIHLTVDCRATERTRDMLAGLDIAQ